MCATSLFFIGERGSKRFRLFRPSGHFHVSENGAGITKKPGAVSCLFYCCTFLYHLLGLRKRMATTFKIGRKQCKRTIYLMLGFTFSLIQGAVGFSSRNVQGVTNHSQDKC